MHERDPAAPASISTLRDALLPSGERVDVTIADGVVIGTQPAGSTTPTGEVHDLAGRLLLPAMGEPHAHVDKALTADVAPNPTGDLQGAIDAWIRAAAEGRFGYDDIVRRSTAALELLAMSGVTAVRSHVNVGATNGTLHLRAVKAARAALEGVIDVQLVALMASPMSGADGAGNRAALVDALGEGVDLVGGCPHLDPDGDAVIAGALAAASEAGIGVDLHVDETLDPDMLTLVDLARQVIDSGFAHPVTASHCVSLGVQPLDVQRSVAALVAEAGIGVVPLPQTNLFLQGRDHPSSTPRGLTAIGALRDAGVVVAAGADNVQDPFNLVGRSDPLETAALLVMAAHLLPDDAYTMVSSDVRSVLGLDPAGVTPGCVADLVAIGAPTVRAAVADAPHDRLVFRRGRLVARSTVTRELVR